MRVSQAHDRNEPARIACKRAVGRLAGGLYPALGWVIMNTPKTPLEVSLEALGTVTGGVAAASNRCPRPGDYLDPRCVPNYGKDPGAWHRWVVRHHA